MRVLAKGILLLLLVGLLGLAQIAFAGVVITDITGVWSTTTCPGSYTITWTAEISEPDTRATYNVYRKFGGRWSTYPWIPVATNRSSTTYKDYSYGTYSYYVDGTGNNTGMTGISWIVTNGFIHSMKRCDGNGEQLGMSQVWNFKYKLQADAYMTIRIFEPGATPVVDTYGFEGSDLSIPATALPGTLVKTLVNRVPRSYEMEGSVWENSEEWDCRDDTGKIVPNGIYWILFEAVVDQDPGDVYPGHPAGGSADADTNADKKRDSWWGSIPVDIIRILNLSATGITDTCPTARIKYKLTAAAEVKIIICKPGTTFTLDASGDPIPNQPGAILRTIINHHDAGDHSDPWDGKDDTGRLLPNGAYTFAISAKDSYGNRALDASGNDGPIWDTVTITLTGGVGEGYPAIFSARAKDTSDNGAGIQAGDQVIIVFTEPVTVDGSPIDNATIDDYLVLSAGHTWRDGLGGIESAIWSAGNTILTITLSTNGGPPTVAVNDSITPYGLRFKDADNNYLLTAPQPIGGNFGLLTDATNPTMLSADAKDNSSNVAGIQTGDQVIINFSEQTNGPPITAANINTVLALSGGHSWLDGSGSIGSAVWSGGNRILTITLSTSTSAPTVAVGDTITPGGNLIYDLSANPLVAPRVIGGGFGTGVGAPLTMDNVVASDASGQGPGIQTGDRVVITFSEATNGPLINAANINAVLALSGGHSWLDGSGSIVSAAWSESNTRLTITLSTSFSAPTVAVGDTITPDELTIKDAALTKSLTTPRNITGDFGAAGPVTPPNITSINPNSGGVGTQVTITGTNFGATPGTSTVNFADGVAAAIVSWIDTQIVCTVPAGAITGNVTVTTAAGPSNGVAFTVTGQPPGPPPGPGFERFEDSVRSYPNPATDGRVTFRCYVDEVPARVTIRVYTIMGEEVWSSEEDVNAPGVYTKIWELENSDGKPVASNLLIYRIELNDPSDSKSLKKKLVVAN